MVKRGGLLCCEIIPKLTAAAKRQKAMHMLLNCQNPLSFNKIMNNHQIGGINSRSEIIRNFSFVSNNFS
jgi:hypothetical protein